jgi:serine/threonine protein kinase
MLVVPDYEICQELSRSEWFFLYRCRCRKDGSSVLLKTPRSDSASPLAVRLLEHEYELLKGLSLPGVVHVHEFLRHDRGCCLVLEDRGGTPLQALLTAHRFDLQAFFPLALQLTTILADLHRREIIHNHINPCSILVHTATGNVCLTDLSHFQAGETQAPPPPLCSAARWCICPRSRLAG